MSIWNPLPETEDILPPQKFVDRVGGDYHVVGRRAFRYLSEYVNLQPEMSVLDIGCGCGRLAVPLSSFLASEYRGLDVAPDMIDWCRKNISPRNPHFQFDAADIYNALYNPSGSLTAETFRLPYESESFDVIVLISVFTHLLPGTVSNYLREASRTLRSNGRILATFFLVNNREEAHEPTPIGLRFQHECEGYWLADRSLPETAVAYSESLVQTLSSDAGLQIRGTHYGRWRRPENGAINVQDAMVFSRL